MRVYLFNRGGDENIGDSLINEVISQLLLDQGIQIIKNLYHLRPNGKFRAISLHIKSYIQDIFNICRTDITLIGGGNLIMDSSKFGARWAIHHFWLSLISKLFNKNYYYICIGVAPLRTSLAKLLYRFVVQHANKVSVRDTFSQRYLSELSGRQDILLWFDPVVLISRIYPAKSNARAEIPKIGICPVQLYPFICSDFLVYQKYITLHVKLIEYFVSSYSVHFFLNDPSKDKKVFSDILEQLPPPIVLKIKQHPKIPSQKDYLELIQSFDFLISSRLHAVITATSYQKPTIGFGWQPKMQYFYQDQNLDGYISILDKLMTEIPLDGIFLEIINLHQKLCTKRPRIITQNLDLRSFLDLERYIS